MALPPTPRRNPRALTASAVKITGREDDYADRSKKDWQERALAYLDLVPELNYASRFYARMLAQLRIFPAIRDEHGNVKPIESGPPLELLNRIQDPAGGRSQIQGSYGRLMFSTGDGYLFGRDLGGDDEKWSFVWKGELEIKDGTIFWKPNENQAAKEYREGSQAVAYRMWTPHPRRSGEADSPMRSAVEGGIAEELIALTKAVRATADSRMLNGILLMPQELSPGPLEPIGDEDPENDPFLTDFIDHASSAIANPGTAEARLPFIVWGSAEFLEKIQHINIHDPATDYMERELRKEAVERLARGMDMPVEVLLGLGQSNHWAARQILDDMWRSHGAPRAEQWTDDLNEAYLRPALKDVDYPDWQNVVIGYDPSQIVVTPDRSEDTFGALDRGLIGNKAGRRELNFKEDDAPTEEEHAEFLALKLRDPGLLDDEDSIVPGERGPAREPAQPARDAAQGPPAPNEDGVSREERMRIIGAAQLAIVRCRTLAGNKLVRLGERSCRECLAPAKDKPTEMVAALIGDATIQSLGTDPRKLVRGGSDDFRSLLQSWGVDDLRAQLLCTLLEEHAAKTLTTAAVTLPDDFAHAVTNGGMVAAA